MRDAPNEIAKFYGLPPLTTGSYLTAMSTMVDKLETKNRKLIFLIGKLIFWLKISSLDGDHLQLS